MTFPISQCLHICLHINYFKTELRHWGFQNIHPFVFFTTKPLKNTHISKFHKIGFKIPLFFTVFGPLITPNDPEEPSPNFEFLVAGFRSTQNKLDPFRSKVLRK